MFTNLREVDYKQIKFKRKYYKQIKQQEDGKKDNGRNKCNWKILGNIYGVKHCILEKDSQNF